jgi:hypothetical protein
MYDPLYEAVSDVEKDSGVSVEVVVQEVRRRVEFRAPQTLQAGLALFVPEVVVGPHSAARALRARPAALASRAFAARDERIPRLSASRRTRPHVVPGRPPLARWAADAREILVVVVFEEARNEMILPANEPDHQRNRCQRKREEFE